MLRIKTTHRLAESGLFRPRWLGHAVAIGLIAGGVGVGAIAASGTTNAAAIETVSAERAVRTNEWLKQRKLDVNSSSDMMKALIMACNEIKARGDQC